MKTFFLLIAVFAVNSSFATPITEDETANIRGIGNNISLVTFGPRISRQIYQHLETPETGTNPSSKTSGDGSLSCTHNKLSKLDFRCEMRIYSVNGTRTSIEDVAKAGSVIANDPASGAEYINHGVDSELNISGAIAKNIYSAMQGSSETEFRKSEDLSMLCTRANWTDYLCTLRFESSSGQPIDWYPHDR